VAVGALLALALHRRTTQGMSRKRWAAIGWAGAIVFIGLNVLDHFGRAGVYGFVAGDLVFAVFAAAIIAQAVPGFSGWRGKLLEFQPLVYTGTISYGLYLLHPLVRIAVGRLSKSGFWHVPALPATALEFVITFVLAALSWRFFEKPINDLKRFFPCERRESKTVDPVSRDLSQMPSK
jgi:peptidoglycan/LPS O-acetylase OafA/YrhL